jgi:type VI secretion system VasD/TssJ family lipoprotein
VKKHSIVLFSFLMLFSLVLFSSACSKPQPMPPVEAKPTYTQNFITVHFKGDSQLNLYDGSSHALHLCVYQLSDPNGFNLLSEDDMGISKLMSCDRADVVVTIPGVASAKRYIIQPGDDKTFELDRAEGAKYVGVVAGYYMLQKRNTVRLFAIPTVEEKKDGLIMVRQKPLTISLYLGPQSLQELGGKP